MDVTAAMEMVNADRQTMTGLRGSKMPILLLILGAIIMSGAICLLYTSTSGLNQCSASARKPTILNQWSPLSRWVRSWARM